MALSVCLNHDYVGRLWLDEQRCFVFQYAESWLSSSIAIPLSLSLPLIDEPYIADTARPFFTNLLPETELRYAIARKLGVSYKNDYALLEAIGGECAGAVSLLPEGQKPDKEGYYQPLSKRGLHELIEQLPRRPMLAGESDMRLSLAGVQNKLPVYFDGEQVSLPHGGLPSSHILKPVIREYQNSTINEAYCMKLAQAVGLSVPDVTLLRTQKQWLYLIRRYDRELDGHKITRLHQEDFCQALSILPEVKYEKEGGIGFAGCFKLIREQSIQPVIDLQQLLNWAVFNYLIGNADAHGKNVSLLLTAQGPKLAPFYDLMSTAIYPDLTNKPAMKIGGEDRYQWIIARSWQKFAEETGVSFKLVKQALEKMSENLAQKAPKLAQQFEQDFGNVGVVRKIQSIIEQRSKKAMMSFDVV